MNRQEKLRRKNARKRTAKKTRNGKPTRGGRRSAADGVRVDVIKAFMDIGIAPTAEQIEEATRMKRMKHLITAKEHAERKAKAAEAAAK